MDLKVTTLEELKQYAQGQIVELPPFADGQPFIARLGRPSMLELAKSGSIPNALLSTAGDLFTGSRMNTKKDNAMSEIFQVIETMCRATFLEPKYDDIKAAGVNLTDEQMLFVFNYTQKGVESLKSFRKIPEHNDSAGNDAAV